MIRTYDELLTYCTFKERYEYLKLSGVIGRETFGGHRRLNQLLYLSPKWKGVRDEVIIRDAGCDLAMDGYEIHDRLLIHHMNPITVEDILNGNPDVFNPKYLITTSFNTHNAIHYSDENQLYILPDERKKGDTCLWRK